MISWRKKFYRLYFSCRYPVSDAYRRNFTVNISINTINNMDILV